MINFKKLLEPHYISNESGELVDARSLPDKSITTEEMARKYLSVPHLVNIYMRALDNKMLLLSVMNMAESLADELTSETEVDKHRYSTYDKSIIFYLDNMTIRYKDIFIRYEVETNYPKRAEVQSLYKKACTSSVVSINGVSLMNLSEIVNYQFDKADVRANTAGFISLIEHYSDSQFLKNFKQYLLNCFYSDKQLNYAFVVEEFIRRIEEGEIF